MPPTFYALLKNFLRAATKQATESNTKRLQDKRNIEPTIHAVGLQVDSEIDLSTRNAAPGCLSTVVINVIKSGAHQRDRYQQRPLVNMVDSR